MIRRKYWPTRYSGVCIVVDNIEKGCTDIGGRGEPYRIGNDIVVDLNQYLRQIEFIWPPYLGETQFGEYWAAIAELEIIPSE